MSECEHINKKIGYRKYSNGTKHYWVQCTRCGKGLQSISHDKAREAAARAKNYPEGIDPLSLIPPFDADLEAQGIAKERELWIAKKAEYEATREAERGQWRDWYGQYLLSSAWREKRAKVLDRASGLCEGCRDQEATEVHHMTYAHVGNEFLFELVALCHACHGAIHTAQGERNGTA